MLSLWFCFLLHSILFLISQTSYRTSKIVSSYELARPLMGTIFLVIITPHAQRERGKVIGRGVHIYIYLLHTSPAHCTFFNDA